MINWNSVKIVATAGPASSSYKTLKAMFNKGLDIVRINFSHGKYEEYKKTIKLVRKIENEIGRPLGILADMPGPKLRVRGIEKPITVKPGSLLVIRKLAPKNDGEISIAYPVILKVLKPGDKISISDGKFTIRVISKTKDTVTCKVIDGTGEIRKGAGLNFPEVDLPIPSVTPEDFKHISFACAHGVDFIGLSFIKEADDLAKVRKHLKKIKASPFLISKIERRAALANLKSIVHATDGVMVARGDLGVEMPIEKVNLLQKEIIKMCNANGKPVITATQMLAFARGETVAVDFAGRDLAVDGARNVDGVFHFFRWTFAERLRFFAERLNEARPHRLARVLRYLADVKRERIRYAARIDDSDFAFAGRRVGRDGDVEHRQCRDGSGLGCHHAIEGAFFNLDEHV